VHRKATEKLSDDRQIWSLLRRAVGIDITTTNFTGSITDFHCDKFHGAKAVKRCGELDDTL
jgi:hypothetical protein